MERHRCLPRRSTACSGTFNVFLIRLNPPDADPQCRNRWLSLVRAGRIEDDTAVKQEFRGGLIPHLPMPESEVCPDPS